MSTRQYNEQQLCKQWLLETDWTTLSDVPLTEENKTEWVTWRAIVRSQVINYNENKFIPQRPIEEWSNE
tara:strand:+ start:358 stop:564 length:207 start_codon:yes stop_codon:yes gene_type:complete